MVCSICGMEIDERISEEYLAGDAHLTCSISDT